MTIDVEYLENNFIIDSEMILNVEVENKKYFYRIVNDFYNISEGNDSNVIKCFADDKEENLIGKTAIFTNYFNFDFKRYLNSINKYLIECIGEQEKNDLIKLYKQLLKKYDSILKKTDLPVVINDEFSADKIIKSIKLDIKFTDELLENLLMVVDLERLLTVNKVLIFINLKQYLSKEELHELYKYALYNNIKIVLIDSQCYGTTNEYEKKIIIDDNLVEQML